MRNVLICLKICELETKGPRDFSFNFITPLFLVIEIRNGTAFVVVV